jgi:hypothetical protein
MGAAIGADDLDARTEKLWDELIQQQERKLLRLAQELRPNVTWDDLLQPQDLPEVANDPTFNYEDGLLAGIKAARMSFRARVLGPLRSQESS